MQTAGAAAGAALDRDSASCYQACGSGMQPLTTLFKTSRAAQDATPVLLQRPAVLLSASAVVLLPPAAWQTTPGASPQQPELDAQDQTIPTCDNDTAAAAATSVSGFTVGVLLHCEPLWTLD